MSASGEHCVLATNFEDNNGDIMENTYTLMLCNALGTPLDTKQVGQQQKITLFLKDFLHYTCSNASNFS